MTGSILEKLILANREEGLIKTLKGVKTLKEIEAEKQIQDGIEILEAYPDDALEKGLREEEE